MRRFDLQRRPLSSNWRHVILVLTTACALLVDNCSAQSSLAADIGPVEDLFFEENTSLPPAVQPNQCAAGKDLRKGVAPRIPGVAMVACPTMTFQCSGHLVRWRMLSIKNNGMTAHLIVWRPTGEPGVHTFIGKISRQMTQKGYVEIIVTDPAEQIRVQPGDFVGVAYDPRSYGGVVPWATHGYADSERDDCVTVAVFGQDLDIPGKIFSLGETYVDRVLMLQAIAEISVGSYPEAHIASKSADIQLYGDSSQEISSSAYSSNRQPQPGTCTTGVEIQAEPISRIPGNFLNVCPTMKITCDGQIQRWEYFSALEDGTPAYLAVFRPVAAARGLNFYLVGMTRVIATHFGPATIDIPASERFYVQAGDVLGVLYDSFTSIGVVPFVDERVLDGYQLSDLQICIKKRVFVEDVRSANSALDFGDTETKRLILLRAHIQAIENNNAHRAIQRSSSRSAVPPSQLAEMAMAMAPAIPSTSGDSCHVGPKLTSHIPSRRPGIWLNVCPNIVIPCSGRIKRWQILSAADDNTPTYLSVWRQEGDGKRKYRLIGYNQIYADTLGLDTIDIEDHDRIEVQAGDHVGVMYDSHARAGSVGFADNDEPEGFSSSEFTNCFRARISKQDSDAQPVQDFGEPMQVRLVLMSADVESYEVAEPCPPPPVVQNARVLKIVDQTITYACQAGYELENDRSTVSCQGGEWTQAPRCFKSTCGDAPTLAHGEVGGGSNEIGAVRWITCKEGFNYEGESATVTCMKGGIWSQPGRCAPGGRSMADTDKRAGTAPNRCGAPPEVAGAHLSGGSGGQQYGDTRQYRCLGGYVMTGNSVIVCLDSGQWTRPPVCNLIKSSEHAVADCGEPMPVDHAILRGQGSKEGTERWYDCEPGYVMQNFPRIVCQSNNEWSTPPSCLPLVCPHPPQVNMATRQFSSRLYNAIATYKCTRPDCVMLGVSELRCSETGQWQPKPPTCLCSSGQELEENKQCPEPPAVSNGKWVVNRMPRGESVTNRSANVLLEMQCNECFERAGQAVPYIRCGRNFLWTRTQTYCKIVECSDENLPTIENGQIGEGEASCNATREIQCIPGYVRSGGRSITCQSDGYWSSPTPRCVAAGRGSSGSCGDVPVVSNGKVDEGGYFVGARRSVLCDTGYRIDTGPFLIFCQSDGTWSRPPNCTRTGCRTPQYNVGNEYSFSTQPIDEAVYQTGTIATFGCKYGFKMVIPATLICTEDGTWDGAPGLCQRIRCYNPPQVRRGYYRPATDEPYYTDTTASLICSPGLQAYNQSVIKCDVNGNWEQPGVCVAACKTPPDVPNGRFIFESEEAYPGSVASLECETGFTVQGEPSITCLADGSWTPTAATCGGSGSRGCSAVPQIPNGRFVIDGTEAELECDIGYRKSGKGGISCLEDGSWTFPTAICVSTNVVCQGLPNVGNGRFVVQSAGINYPGTLATLECSPGYTVLGEKEITCEDDGSWGKEFAICVFSDRTICSPLPTISNGHYFIENDNDVRYPGTSAKLHCEPGNEMIGDKTITCVDNGSWAPLTGSCRPAVPVICNPLPVLQNGRYLINSVGPPGPGTVAALECSQGYERAGERSITCLIDGSWTPSSASCQRSSVECGDVPNIANGFARISGRVTGSRGRVYCNPGYKLNGREDGIICSSDGTWIASSYCVREEEPTPVECGNPPAITHGTIRPFGTTVGSRGRITCNSGYTLVGPDDGTVCSSDGVWTTTSYCQTIGTGCYTVQPIVVNGIVTVRSGNFGELGTLTCNPGYELRGLNRVVCERNGRWQTYGICVNATQQCSNHDLPTVPHAHLVETGVPTRWIIACHDGYVWDGVSQFLICLQNGTWVAPGRCLPINCGNPEEVENGSFELTGTRLGSIAVLKCSNAFTVVGNSIIQCLSTGHWTQPGQCVKIMCENVPSIKNGRYLLAQPHSKSPSSAIIARLVCHPGFTINGDDTLRCQINGTWSRPGGSCAASFIECTQEPTVSNGYIARGGYEVGTIRMVQCNPGYVLSGPSQIVCKADASWTDPGSCSLEEPEPIRECGQVPRVPFGYVERGSFEIDVTRQLVCRPGYYIVGPTEIICKDDGYWTDPGVCTREVPGIKCGQIPVVLNARVLPTARRRSKTWRVVCNPGFALPNRKQWTLVSCTKEGRWRPPPPVQCEEPGSASSSTLNRRPPPPVQTRCPEIAVQYAITTGAENGVGATRQILCMPGYETPVRSVICQSNGVWSPSPPKSCTPKDCGSPSPVRNGDIRPGGTRFGDVRYVTCRPSYALTGPNNITCTANGWSRSPVCTLVEGPTVRESDECPVTDLPQISNGVWNANQRRQVPFDGIVRASCVTPCYELRGSPVARCGQFSTWNVTRGPTCIIKDCGNYPDVQDAYTSPPIVSKTCGSKFRYICNTGFFQVGPQEIECSWDGQWKFLGSADAPALCLKNVTERCSIRVPEIPGASINVGTDTVGSQRLVTCLPGYEMTPQQLEPAYLSCGPNLRWVTPEINCLLTGCDRLPDLKPGLEPAVTTPPTGTYPTGASAVVRCASSDRSLELSGNAAITCLGSNVWSPQPDCLPIGPTESCRLGKSVPTTRLAVEPRSNVACPILSAECAGDADTWVFYSAVDDGTKVSLRLYRPIGSTDGGEDTVYMLVNETSWFADRVGRVVLPLEVPFRIMPGDFIGIHYPDSDYTSGNPAQLTGGISVIPYADIDNLGNMAGADLVTCYYQSPTSTIAKQDFAGSIPRFVNTVRGVNVTWEGVLQTRMMPSLQLVVRRPGFCGEPEIENGRNDYLASSDGPGYVVQFRCREEYEIIGPRRATCGENGNWTQLPTCELHKAIPCSAGRQEALERNPNRLVLPRQLYVFPDYKITCSARITEWHFWADAPIGNNTVIYLSMWRSFRGRLYYLVGGNRVPVLHRGLNVYKIPSAEQFDVDADSFLGIHFDGSDGTKFISYFDELHPGNLVPHKFSVFTSKSINEVELQEDIAKYGYLSMEPVDVQNRIAPAIFARGHSLVGCGLPPPTPYGRYKLSDGTHLDSRADYTCVAGTNAADGITSSVCQEDKSWSTPRPVCIKEDLCYSGRNGSRLPMVFSTSFLNIYTDYSFTCAGVVTKWNFFSRNYSAVLYLGVWRKERGLLNSYRLVGYTKVSTSKIGWTSYDVDDDQVIPVQKGDVIGVHYKETKLPQRDVGIGFATPLSAPREPRATFSSGFALDISHDEIMRSGGLVQFTGPHFKQWRLPSVMAVIQTTTLSCGRLPHVPHSRVSGSGPGQFQFQCDANFVLVGQSDTITCQPDGRWTDPPVCRPNDDCEWNNLLDTNNKWAKYSGQSGNLKIFTSLPIGCQGWIKRWEFYSTKVGGTVHLVVWRKLATGMMIQVKKNTFRTTRIGLEMFTVPPDNQIQVMPGDYIGFHYNSVLDRIIPLGRPEDNIAEDLILDGYDEHLSEADLTSTDARTMTQQKRAIGAPALRAYILNQQEKVYQQCIDDTRCPLQSICTYRPCLDRVCVCKSGFWPNTDKTACVRALQLGQACGGDDSVCGVFGAVCDPIKQVCVCAPDFEPTDRVVPTRCRPVSPVVKRQALLGEHCDNTTNVCYDLYRTVFCSPTSSNCECTSAYRPATEDELVARPDELRQCLPKGYKLNNTFCPIVAQYQRAERGVGIEEHVASSSSPSIVLPAVLSSLAVICVGGLLCIALILFRRNRQRRCQQFDLFSTFSSAAIASNESSVLQRAASSPSKFLSSSVLATTSTTSETTRRITDSTRTSTTSSSNRKPASSNQPPRLSTITS